MKIDYIPSGVCSQHIQVELEADIVRAVRFTRGCAGNTQGVAALAVGRSTDELIASLRGIICRNDTSCPDQLARALEAHRLQQGG